MKHQEIVIIVDFGGQYAQLIARRVRECGVYCEILPYNKPASEILVPNLKGIISVSYTHLDVYKRQGQHPAKKNTRL